VKIRAATGGDADDASFGCARLLFARARIVARDQDGTKNVGKLSSLQIPAAILLLLARRIALILDESRH
jgi:hypothetical protein